MKKINLTSAKFEKLIEGKALYVDKTDYIWKMIDSGDTEFFLSRPRRFGKSLLVSTLKALFQGRRDLFSGLFIDRMDYDWEAYPVIHLDFGNSELHTATEVRSFLMDALDNFSLELGIPLRGRSLNTLFENLISDTAKATKTGSVVVLVDEYDKPILGNVINKRHNKAILSILKGFYSNIKKKEGVIRFAFITGVSKFAHVSLFSDLNNLTDITLDEEYAGMLGFTEKEIREYFAERIPLAAKANGVPKEELMRKVLKWYDGYRFSDDKTHVCNPVSVSSFFAKNYKFSNYWDDTGTPSFLVKLAREKEYDYETALNEWYDKSVFSAYELDRLDVTGLLWQTGYLTIKETRQDEDGMEYRLDFPDQEVQSTFSRRLIEAFAGDAKGDTAWNLARKLRTAIREDDLNGFMTTFQTFLASIPYDLHLPYEKYYHTIFFSLFKLIGASIDAESHTSEGRIDAYVRTAKNVYIFEFKLDKSAEVAIGQIVGKRYYEKFLGGDLPVVMVGVNFDSEKGRIDDWKRMDG